MNKFPEKKSITVILPLILALFSYFMTGLLRLSAVVAMPVLQEKLQLSATTVGFVSSAFYITYALIQVVGGALCLRFGAMTVLYFCFAISAAGSFLFATASTPLHIMFGRILLGLGVGPTFVTVLSVIQANFEGKEYAKWMGIAFVVSNAGAIFSSAPLQMAINSFGIRSLFIFFAELLLCCAVMTFILARINGKQNVSKETGLWKEIGDVSKFIVKSRIICGCFVLWIISNSMLGVYQSLWCVKWTSCAFSVRSDFASYSGTLIGIGVILGCLLGDNLKNKNISRMRYIINLAIMEVTAYLLLTVVKNIADSVLYHFWQTVYMDICLEPCVFKLEHLLEKIQMQLIMP